MNYFKCYLIFFMSFFLTSCFDQIPNPTTYSKINSKNEEIYTQSRVNTSKNLDVKKLDKINDFKTYIIKDDKFSKSIGIEALNTNLEGISKIGYKEIKLSDEEFKKFKLEGKIIENPEIKLDDPKPDKLNFNLKFVPNDSLFTNQYSLVKIHAREAFEYLKSEKGAFAISILDTGIDKNHPDLQEKISNKGFSVFNDEPDAYIDLHGHGTHVAGIASAISNNNYGISGVSPNSGQIISVKVLNENGLGDHIGIAKGLIWSADQPEIKVINMSLGGLYNSQILQDAVNYALSKGKIILAAMGNNGSSSPNYPAAIPGVIAVGSTDSFDQKAYFSNTGNHISVVSPGVDIISTMPKNQNTIGLTNFGYLSGTSMSTPIISGIFLSLVNTNSNLSNDELKQIVETTADDLGVSGFDTNFGFGRVNYERALNKVLEKTPLPSPTPTLTASSTPVPSPTSTPTPSSTPLPTPTSTPTPSLTPVPSSTPIPTPLFEGKIVFQDDSNGKFDIILLDTATNKRSNLTGGIGTNKYPSISKDGSKVTFYSDRFGSRWSIVSVNIDGTGMKRLTSVSQENCFNPIFSESGDKIYFSSTRNGETSIYSINLDGSNEQKIVNGDLASISLDGKKLVFVKKEESDYDVFIANIDGSDVKKIYNDDYFNGSPVLVGNKVLFTAQIYDSSTSDILSVNLDGSELEKITNNTFFDGDIVRTKEGNIIFSSLNASKTAIYYMDLNTKKITLLIESNGNLRKPSIAQK